MERGKPERLRNRADDSFIVYVNILRLIRCTFTRMVIWKHDDMKGGGVKAVEPLHTS